MMITIAIIIKNDFLIWYDQIIILVLLLYLRAKNE